ncbi:DgyrCDS13466 [Dimorphilus gyrociliatus]|uniref:DgyrCDS13466 n=1 Tax=Dimorphilus gyrociliatus TaxID=2664684 RepID=A0A7I8WAS3_9ANNE|nr:DgyrCDS13466 [Dimorphilus gyrociliatus]
MSAARPQLRGLLKSQLKRDFSIAAVLSVGAAVMWQAVVVLPRKRRYEAFLTNLDADKEFIRMREAGVFQSVKPGGEINDEAW